MKHLLIALLVSFAALAAQAYSSLEALMEDMARQEMEALTSYVDGNPDAVDISEARQLLVYRLMAEEKFDEALGHLQVMYAALPADKSQIELDTVGEVLVQTLQLYQIAGKTNELNDFVEKVREDFGQHEQAELINSSLDDFLQMAQIERPSVGEVLDISFTSIDGREVATTAMTGKVVLVDFWATWCGPCIKVMPAIKALHEAFNGKGFEVVGISLDGEREDLEEYIEKEAITWPQYFDGLGWENEWAVKFGIDSIPATYLLGPDGKIVAINPSEEELRALIVELLPSGE